MANKILKFSGIPVYPSRVNDPPQIATDTEHNQGWRFAESPVRYSGPLKVSFKYLKGGSGALAQSYNVTNGPEDHSSLANGASGVEFLAVQYSTDEGKKWHTFESGSINPNDASDTEFKTKTVSLRESGKVKIRFITRVSIQNNYNWPIFWNDRDQWGIDDVVIESYRGSHDNEFVRRQIPQSDLSYSWIKASTTSTSFSGYESDNYLDDKTLEFITTTFNVELNWFRMHQHTYKSIKIHTK